MQLDKSKKRILKRSKMGFQGYPTIAITYYGSSDSLATEVVIEFVAEAGQAPQVERFKTTSDIREDESVQSAIVKMIERSVAKSVTLNEDVITVSPN